MSEAGADMGAHSGLLLDMRQLRIAAEVEGRMIPLIDGIDLQVRRGEVLGVIGESGAGKSTLGLAAMGFTRPGCRITGGSLLFDGIDLLALPESGRRALRGTRIAYVAQSAAASFNPAYRLLPQTVETSVIHHISRRREATSRAIDLYGQLQLPSPGTIGTRFPHQVSGGQLQRAMTAMAMTCRPDLIVFDEPTTALDVTTQVEVLAAIRRIVEQYNTAAIYITHDLAVVAQMAHRVMVLRHGNLIEEAPTRAMLSAPEEAYTKSLWSVRMLEKTPVARKPVILSIKGLEARYGDFKALENVTLDLPEGSIVAVVGESGSGKSTLARVLSGVMPQTAGSITFRGEPLPPSKKARGRDLLRRIQMIYQSADTALNPHHTIETIIGRPLQRYLGLRGRARRQRVGEILQLVGIPPERMQTRPPELSGGQKQRVAIARALAAEPDIFICDEVTSALDQLVQEQILKLILKLQKDMGRTFVFITHDIETVRAISDHVVVMHRGRIVEQGPATELLANPTQAYTKELLASVPQMDPDWLRNTMARRGETLDHAPGQTPD